MTYEFTIYIDSAAPRGDGAGFGYQVHCGDARFWPLRAIWSDTVADAHSAALVALAAGLDDLSASVSAGDRLLVVTRYEEAAISHPEMISDHLAIRAAIDDAIGKLEQIGVGITFLRVGDCPHLGLERVTRRVAEVIRQRYPSERDVLPDRFA